MKRSQQKRVVIILLIAVVIMLVGCKKKKKDDPHPVPSRIEVTVKTQESTEEVTKNLPPNSVITIAPQDHKTFSFLIHADAPVSWDIRREGDGVPVISRPSSTGYTQVTATGNTMILTVYDTRGRVVFTSRIQISNFNGSTDPHPVNLSVQLQYTDRSGSQRQMQFPSGTTQTISARNERFSIVVRSDMLSLELLYSMPGQIAEQVFVLNVGDDIRTIASGLGTIPLRIRKGNTTIWTGTVIMQEGNNPDPDPIVPVQVWIWPTGTPRPSQPLANGATVTIPLNYRGWDKYWYDIHIVGTVPFHLRDGGGFSSGSIPVTEWQDTAMHVRVQQETITISASETGYRDFTVIIKRQ